jgi:hypothetical protein
MIRAAAAAMKLTTALVPDAAARQRGAPCSARLHLTLIAILTAMAQPMTFDVRPMLEAMQADNARGREFDRDPLWSRLSPQSGRLMQGYVRYVATRRPSVYGLFGQKTNCLRLWLTP